MTEWRADRTDRPDPPTPQRSALGAALQPPSPARMSGQLSAAERATNAGGNSQTLTRTNPW